MTAGAAARSAVDQGTGRPDPALASAVARCPGCGCGGEPRMRRLSPGRRPSDRERRVSGTDGERRGSSARTGVDGRWDGVGGPTDRGRAVDLRRAEAVTAGAVTADGSTADGSTADGSATDRVATGNVGRRAGGRGGP